MNGLKIYSWNVNGIRAVTRKGSLQDFLDKHDPDILCLQETKAYQDQSEIDLPQYQEYWCSAQRKGHFGTAIFSKTKPLRVVCEIPNKIAAEYGLDEDGYGKPNQEGRVVAAEYEKFWLVSVYTPNSKDNLTRLELRHKHWDPAFLEYMKSLEKSKPVVFCGDLNVAHTEEDLARPKENVGKHGFTDEERANFQKIVDAGFIDTYRLFHKGSGHYSWWSHWADARTRNVGWRIDYFLASKSLTPKIKKSEIHPNVMGSDHCPISIELAV